MLQSMGLQRVKQDSVTEQQQFSLIMLVIQMNKLAIEAVFYQDMIKLIYKKKCQNYQSFSHFLNNFGPIPSCLLVLGTWNLMGATTEQVSAALQRQDRPSRNDLNQSYCCCCYSVTKSWPTLCNPMDCSMPGSPILHYLLELLLYDPYYVMAQPLLVTTMTNE